MRLLLLILFAVSAVLAEVGPYSLPIVDLADETHRQTVVDREPGQYLGHPSTLLLPDNRTILMAYPKGHGKGPVVYKKSFDGGRTWTERLPTPENWETSMETPTLYRLVDPQGKPRIVMFSGKAAGIRTAYSEDEGESWTPLQPLDTPGPSFGGIVAMSSLVELRAEPYMAGAYMAFFHDDGRWLREPPEHTGGKHFKVYTSVTRDGGLTWSQPVVAAEDDQAHLCEPGALRSPDGGTIAVLLRENSRTRPSFVIFSDDEGETWSAPRELPAALTGDRHTAKYAPDGRLLITFRDNGVPSSPTKGDWVAWVGTWDDVVSGGEGQYRVRLMDNTKGSDTAYPGLELLPDGTFVATTYGHWTQGEEPYIVSVRFTMEELDRRAKFAADGLTSLVATSAASAVSGSGPNVLFIALDDLNDWAVEPDSPLHMPNFQRLARRGTLFTRAYTASPACNPSRAALMLGLSTAATGIYGNRSDWRRAVPDAVTLPQHFMRNGYRVEGAGKIFHHHDNSAFHDDASFHRFLKMQLDPIPSRKLNSIYDVKSENYDWGQWPSDETTTPDYRAVDYGVRFLGQERAKPFFLAIGIFRPHMPFHAPPKYFSFYPPDKVVMPKMFDRDLDDIPSGGKSLLERRAYFFRAILDAERGRPGTWRQAVRAYQASCTFADHQLGRLLDALGRSPYAGNTIVALWSDHGYHLGEKRHWEKFALWERSTRVPLIILAPGVTTAGTEVERPVSLLDLYPTLVELAGLPAKEELDGSSLVPLLQDPKANRDPAVMTFEKGNHAVRSDRWRYIRYADGSEELYDHADDPNEWRNVVAEHPDVVTDLRRWLPTNDADSVADLAR